MVANRFALGFSSGRGLRAKHVHLWARQISQAQVGPVKCRTPTALLYIRSARGNTRVNKSVSPFSTNRRKAYAQRSAA